MNDTSAEMERKVRELLMQRPGVDRLQMTSDMFDAARTLVMAAFPPGLTEGQVRNMLCQRFYDGEVDVNGFARAVENNA